jgi:hypothetical protein
MGSLVFAKVFGGHLSRKHHVILLIQIDFPAPSISHFVDSYQAAI